MIENSMDLGTTKIAIELQLADIDDLLDGLYDEEDIPDLTRPLPEVVAEPVPALPEHRLVTRQWR
jgi:hypothetical protein